MVVKFAKVDRNVLLTFLEYEKRQLKILIFQELKIVFTIRTKTSIILLDVPQYLVVAQFRHNLIFYIKKRVLRSANLKTLINDFPNKSLSLILL